MSNLTVIADHADMCGEAPVWDVAKQKLYWADCGGLKFFCYDWHTKKTELLKEDVEVNGCALNQAGGFVVTNNSGIWLWDGTGAPTLVVAQAEGATCRLNDCIADPKGRVLAGSWFYDPTKDYELGRLFCLDTNGSIRVLDEGFHLANGLGFSPDGRTLYFTDSFKRTIHAYDYDIDSGHVRNGRVIIKVADTAGLPDGLTVDAEGFIWSAEWYGSCVARYDPDGKLERRINTPAKQTSSLTFGGPNLTDIFVTSAAKSEPMPVMPPGYDPQSGYFGGALFHVNVGIQGKPEYKANIRVEPSERYPRSWDEPKTDDEII